MEYRKATKEDTEQVALLVQDTIRTIYPKYYPINNERPFPVASCGEYARLRIKKGTNSGIFTLIHLPV